MVNKMIGKKIKLVHMDDPYGVPDESTGTIDFIDDAGQIHISWNCGSYLALIPKIDKFIFIDDEK